MSGLVPFAVLVSTVRALKGATVVGDNITEAPIEEVEQLLAQAGARPVIAVYVGNEDAVAQGRDLLEGRQRLEIAFQVFLPESTSVELNGDVIQLDTRGLAAGYVFASIWRQIMRALQDGTTPWSRRWNSFVMRVHQVVTHPFEFEIPGKIRGGAREIVMIVEPADEPEYGVEPYPIWADFIEGLRGEPDYGPMIANLLTADITGPELLPSWRVIQTSLGLSLESARALGFTPYDETETGEAPVLQSVDLDQQFDTGG